MAAEKEAAGPRLAGVLLDLDGVLIDSVPFLRAGFARFLAAHGIPPGEGEFESWNGPPLHEIVAGLQRKHRLTGSPAALMAQYLEILGSIERQELSLMPGASALLDWLHSHALQIGIVTSSPAARSRDILERLGVLRQVSVLVAGDELARGKPDPAPYLEALGRIGLAAARVIAIEDSVDGVAAAVSAGISSVGLGGPGTASSLLRGGAQGVAGSLAQVRSILSDRIGPVWSTAARDLDVQLDSSRVELDRGTESLVLNEWAAALKENPTLFDGGILLVSGWHLGPGVVTVHVQRGAYRMLVAQHRGIPLGLRALAASGLAVTSDGRVAVGRRSAQVSRHKGAWELVPSGGVPIDVIDSEGPPVPRHLLKELEEEMGIAESEVVCVDALGLIEDFQDATVDLGYRIALSLDGDEVRQRAARHAQTEYDRFDIMPLADATRLLSRSRSVPTSRALLELYSRDA